MTYNCVCSTHHGDSVPATHQAAMMLWPKAISMTLRSFSDMRIGKLPGIFVCAECQRHLTGKSQSAAEKDAQRQLTPSKQALQAIFEDDDTLDYNKPGWSFVALPPEEITPQPDTGKTIP